MVRSLGSFACGPVGLIHAHRVGIEYKKPTLGRRPIHVCFREKSGHRILSASSPFMTHMRHWRLPTEFARCGFLPLREVADPRSDGLHSKRRELSLPLGVI